MTAALAEVGFMTNADEEAKLLTPAYQQAAAQGIADGILEYLKWSTTVYTSESLSEPIATCRGPDRGPRLRREVSL